ncbi:PASTA domain-containing protein [bacterium]|nr:PASTA domain-containing protein [bacterium]
MASHPASRALLRWFTVVAGIFVVLILLFFIFDRFVMPLYTRQGIERPIPELVGLSTEEAKRRADSSGFIVVLDAPKMGGNVPEGTVLEQRPFARALAKPGRKIRVVPAVDVKRDLAPDVVGLKVRDAQIRCRNVNLLCTSADIVYEFSSEIPRDIIVSQEPEPGASVAPGDAVKLMVSLGPRPDHFFIPYLMEKPLHEARLLLRESGLKLGRIVRKETDLYPTGTVIAQSLRSGQEVEPETAVDLVVAVPVLRAAPDVNPVDSLETEDSSRTISTGEVD